MLTQKTSKRASGLVLNLFFSYESFKIFGPTIFPLLSLQIIRYSKQSSTIMRKEKEISFKDFEKIPKAPTLYFVKGNIISINFFLIFPLDEEDLSKLFQAVKTKVFYVVQSSRNAKFQGK